MTFKETIATYETLLPSSASFSTTEAERRAGEFLVIMAKITDWRHQLHEDKIKKLTVQTATFAEQMSLGTSSTMTQNKMVAEASKPYEKAREDLERVENDLSYLKAMFDVFNNAHIFYRGIAKDTGAF